MLTGHEQPEGSPALPFHAERRTHHVRPDSCLHRPALYFNFYDSAEAALADLDRANADSLAPTGGYVLMRYADWARAKRAFMLSDPLAEITEAQFFYALEVLPPEAWTASDGLERFLMSEHESGTYTNQYAAYKGRYFARMVDATDRSTWITVQEIDSLQ